MLVNAVLGDILLYDLVLFALRGAGRSDNIEKKEYSDFFVGVLLLARETVALTAFFVVPDASTVIGTITPTYIFAVLCFACTTRCEERKAAGLFDKEYRKDFAMEEKRLLSEEELENVSGGCGEFDFDEWYDSLEHNTADGAYPTEWAKDPLSIEEWFHKHGMGDEAEVRAVYREKCLKNLGIFQKYTGTPQQKVQLIGRLKAKFGSLDNLPVSFTSLEEWLSE